MTNNIDTICNNVLLVLADTSFATRITLINRKNMHTMITAVYMFSNQDRFVKFILLF